MDLTHQHTNHSLLVEDPEITVRPVGYRRPVVGAAMNPTTIGRGKGRVSSTADLRLIGCLTVRCVP